MSGGIDGPERSYPVPEHTRDALFRAVNEWLSRPTTKVAERELKRRLKDLGFKLDDMELTPPAIRFHPRGNKGRRCRIVADFDGTAGQ